MANTSFLNAPDLKSLGRAAGALGVDEPFVEKDWYVVEAIRILLSVKSEHFGPVFSGGTCLLKAHKLINRFSEGIDFKLTFLQAERKQAFRYHRTAAWRYCGLFLAWRESRIAKWSDINSVY